MAPVTIRKTLLGPKIRVNIYLVMVNCLFYASSVNYVALTDFDIIENEGGVSMMI